MSTIFSISNLLRWRTNQPSSPLKVLCPFSYLDIAFSALVVVKLTHNQNDFPVAWPFGWSLVLSPSVYSNGLNETPFASSNP
jgi:hypothetical protein